jgi:hypothetical protein
MATKDLNNNAEIERPRPIKDSDVPEHLSCDVCFDLIVEPTMLSSCGHTFCFVCCSKMNSCPTCRKSKDKTVVNFKVKQMVTAYLEQSKDDLLKQRVSQEMDKIEQSRKKPVLDKSHRFTLIRNAIKDFATASKFVFTIKELAEYASKNLESTAKSIGEEEAYYIADQCDRVAVCRSFAKLVSDPSKEDVAVCLLGHSSSHKVSQESTLQKLLDWRKKEERFPISKELTAMFLFPKSTLQYWINVVLCPLQKKPSMDLWLAALTDNDMYTKPLVKKRKAEQELERPIASSGNYNGP